jgi:NADH dehydrogenase
MRIAITGGTGFVGAHLAARLAADGHELALLGRHARPDLRAAAHKPIAFVTTDLSDTAVLTNTFQGCDAIVHCAGINREIGAQTYARVHIEGTANVLQAAKRAGARKIVLTSFLRARPNCGSGYHESKWAAEELVRNSGMDYTVLKCGIIYGRGDHMLSHLRDALGRFPLFATVGFKQEPIAPVAVHEVIEVICAALDSARLSNSTYAVTGPEELDLGEIVRRVASAIGKRAFVVPAPVWFQSLLAQIFERTMRVPLVSRAQVRILAESLTEAALPCEMLPQDLRPRSRFTPDQIRAGLARV